MQKGPTFAVFPEWFFDIICRGDPVSVIESVSTDDVPINAASSNLRSLIQKLDEAKTDEEIDQILENQVFLEEINQSQWPVEVPINTNSKHRLIQQLIMNETIY